MLTRPAIIVASLAVASAIAFLVWRAFQDSARHRVVRGVLQGICALMGAMFVGFTYWTERLPVLRGSQWNLRDALVRSGAVVTGMFFVVGTVVALLPWTLDRLERGPFAFYVAARHVRAKKSGFLTLISMLSIFAVALASFSLSAAISVMGGFSADLKRKILGNNAHIVVDTTSQAPWGDYEATLDRVRAVHGVMAATPIVQGEVMASSASNLAGVIVHGVAPATIGNVIDLRKNIEAPVKVDDKLAYLESPELLRHIPADEVIGIGPGGEEYTKGPELPPLGDDLDPQVAAIIAQPPLRPGLVVGRELAKTLHVYVGDEVTLVSPLGDLGPMGVMPKTRKFRIAAIFYSGMYEYDATHVYVTIDEAQSYFAEAGKISAIEVKVDDAENADRMTPAVTEAVGRPELRVRDWREMNKNLFSALKLERIATFLILSIEIIVASFCIVCTLLLMMTEKAKEIAILKALGATDGTIMRTFMTEGIIIGGIGTLLGVATGVSVCTGLAWFGLRLDPDVYYIDRLPINVSGPDYVAVTLAALTICTIATIFPAKQAAQLRPVDGLRYE
jgi:lipoprotein-releasing system permease protein